jgi:lysophospholipase L1-like esterase
MSDPYLLAASLISLGPISVPPPPALPIKPFNDLSTLLASTTARLLKSVVTPEIVPIVETITAEFSPLPSQATEQPQPFVVEDLTPVLIPKTARAATESATPPQTLPIPSTTVVPTSGSQLYLQRLAALKAGKLYTRLPADSFHSIWAKQTYTQALKQPTHEQWIRLLEQEAKSVAKGQGSNRLGILLGDSLSMWFPSQGFPSQQLWLNQGISGENSSQILRRISAFSKTRPDTIYVLAGINDLRQGVSDEVILSNIRQIVLQLRQNHPQAQVVVQSILPTRASTIGNERIRNLNQQIAAIARQQGAGFLNLHRLFANSQGEMQPDLTTDGIHLTHRGYEVWQEALQYTESVLAAQRVDLANQADNRL